MIDTVTLSRSTIPVWSNLISNLVQRDNSIAGAVVRIVRGLGDNEGEAVSLIVDLVSELATRDIPTAVYCASDDLSFLEDLDFQDLCGIIIGNACILRDGERSDYFRSDKLRKVMTRCGSEREERPGFFVGFHDLWDDRPSAAVVCRGFKVAKHFDAILEHGPTSGFVGLPELESARSLSAFAFLRKEEICQLQAVWLQQKRKVHLNSEEDTGYQIARLAIDELQPIIPEIGDLLANSCSELWSRPVSTFTLSTTPALDYVALAPPRVDFWEMSPSGVPISPLGCMPLTVTASAAHYHKVLAIQVHLRDLKMLQPLDVVEIDELIGHFRDLQQVSAQFYLIRLLVEGLAARSIVVYKGLASGFVVPDSSTEFWGVSASSDDADLNVVNIFLSRRSPCDAATLLHVWLAHHGVSRAHRYEEELRLVNKSSNSTAASLPNSIQAAIDRATPSEALSLLQQIQVAGLCHFFRAPIEEYCTKVLIDDVSSQSWDEAHSHGYLDGTISMCQLLDARLQYFAKRGARSLPSLQNMIRLHERIDMLVGNALFQGEDEALNTLSNAILHAYDPLGTWHECGVVDINADLVATIFFCALRKAALEDVYLEATDHCPVFSQPDQAAVFAELWVLGSQCELYFGIVPRTLGDILFQRHNDFLTKHPPTPVRSDKEGKIMSMFAKSDPSNPGGEHSSKASGFGQKASEFGSLSVFCLPAMLDIVLLTFVGRGLFMTAYMGDGYLVAACYALLISLLLSAGITGWVGSVGNYYLAHYAYGNMTHFHVQRLSGGFILTLLAGFTGTLVFFLKTTLLCALTFLAYLMLISTYLNLLGVLATMHQRGSPLTSGRTVLWRSIPLLFVSPAISSLINGYDLAIYLSTGYMFLGLLLFQYRRLCHEWMSWTENIPKFSERDVLDWYASRTEEKRRPDDTSESSIMIDRTECPGSPKELAIEAFRQNVSSYQQNVFGVTAPVLSPDPLVRRVVRGLPYIDWLLRKGDGTKEYSALFSASWFAQLSQATKTQQQTTQGLKEHSTFVLFRYSGHDVTQNVGLFLICLMDRWVSITMAAVASQIDIFSHYTSRYSICFAILYFCTVIMVLDVTLQDYWHSSYEMSTERLSGCAEALAVTKSWEMQVRSRRRTYRKALFVLCSRMGFAFGVSSMFVWILVDNVTMLRLYYLYTVSYSGIIIFQTQFNRCFTLDLKAHVTSIIVAAAIGYLTGCVLHISSIERTPMVYMDAIALCVSAVVAAILTTIWVFGGATPATPLFRPRVDEDDPKIVLGRPRITSLPGITSPPVWAKVDGAPPTLAQVTRVTHLLNGTLDIPEPHWSTGVFELARTMWQSGRMRVNLCNRAALVDTGFQDFDSISRVEEGVLELILATNDTYRVEFGVLSQNSAVTYLIAQAVLYHISRSMFSLSDDQATYIEALISPSGLPERLDLELSQVDMPSLPLVERLANSRLLKHLSLGVNVDSRWHELPSGIRQLILSRVQRRVATVETESKDWMDKQGYDVRVSDFHLQLTLMIYERISKLVNQSGPLAPLHDSTSQTDSKVSLSSSHVTHHWDLAYLGAFVSRFPITFAKWVAIISGGSSNVERELWFEVRNRRFVRAVALPALLSAWAACRRVRNFCIYASLIYRHHALVNIAQLSRKGAVCSLQKNRVVVQLRRRFVTGFLRKVDDDGSMVMDIFEGLLDKIPTSTKPTSHAVYDENFRLVTRCDKSKEGQSLSQYFYTPEGRLRYPQRKAVTNDHMSSLCHYDGKGRVTHGAITLDETQYAFRYFYRRDSTKNREILRADFRLHASGSQDTLQVFWGVLPSDNRLQRLDWIPTHRVARVVKRIGGDVYITNYDYRHRRDPVMTTIRKDETANTALLSSPRLFQHEDSFLQRPEGCIFENDDLLACHPRHRLKVVSKQLSTPHSWASIFRLGTWQYRRAKVVYRRIPTWWLRTELWNHWRTSGTLDALAACWMDEMILREEPLLRPYWKARELGKLDLAAAILDSSVEQISAAIDMDKEVSEVCMLPIKSSDLYAMGLSRDANQMTLRPQDCYHDTDTRISVIFNDLGCWPDSPGGVSNCRRDLVDGHSTIRNHVLAESANDYGIPRFQIERNVQSLKTLPLWGLDGRTANHGLIDNLLESEVEEKIGNTDLKRDVEGVFVPLLKLFVKGARSRSISKQDMITYSNAVLEMFTYFEQKDYNLTWNSKEVSNGWVEAWLTHYDDPNIINPSGYFEIEKPSLSDFRTALAIYSSYFFIFSVQTPEDCPQVFQSTHHGISSLFGMFLKHKRGCTFGIWDHAILWRECCLNLSPAQSTLTIPVQSMVLSGIGLAMRLAYFHADVVLPCTSVFNPIWEAELGTDSNRLGHKSLFTRKIDPIVNGVSNMNAFKPVEQIRSSKPTVVMLSNVQFIKDIKTAILAADVIVNTYGFLDYQLFVYGARDREPSYDIDMTKLIESCELAEHVFLKGFSKPQDALQDAWLFMNSSLSEGLPLAIAEAALAGVPIVATAVGATALVLTDPDKPSVRYGEVVPPNDPTALARAQIAILAMAGQWARFAGDVDGRGSVLPHLLMPDRLTAKDVGWLNKRMYEKTEDRKKLGMLGRQVVLKGFHGERYLREHEQMYWVQWHWARMRRGESGGLPPEPVGPGGMGIRTPYVKWRDGKEVKQRKKLRKRRLMRLEAGDAGEES
ncbi:hypothetical protein OQA88_8609 [Cercophora sp. LCS_1]